MAKFNKGDWVRVQPNPDFYWNYWTAKHTEFCDKVVEVARVEKSKNNPNVFFLGLRHPAGKKSCWFQDKHCVVEEDYDSVFVSNMQRAVDRLNEYEAIARKCRDDILRSVFSDDDRTEIDKDEYEEFWDDNRDKANYVDDDEEEEDDEYEEDWINVKTKPMVPLPGKKIRTRTKMKKSYSKSRSLSDSAYGGMNPMDWMTDNEIDEYLDTLFEEDI